MIPVCQPAAFRDRGRGGHVRKRHEVMMVVIQAILTGFVRVQPGEDD
jgi:hypothetical protein